VIVEAPGDTRVAKRDLTSRVGSMETIVGTVSRFIAGRVGIAGLLLTRILFSPV
jgi:hypothetical protein